MSSFRWIEGSLNPSYQENRLVNVMYTSLNFKDVMGASGKIKFDFGRMEDCVIGFEYVGFDNNGRRVMGMYKNK